MPKYCCTGMDRFREIGIFNQVVSNSWRNTYSIQMNLLQMVNSVLCYPNIFE